jgi:AP2 domain/HNH endonuclease
MMPLTYRTIPVHVGRVVGASAIVDIADFEWLSQYRWRLVKGYATRTTSRRLGPRRSILMHREILGLNDPSVPVDHRDRDRLNNRRSNLRVANRALNAQNKSLYGNNASGYRGVGWDKNNSRWQAYGKIKGRQVHLGRYSNIEDAARAAAAFRAENMPFSEEAQPCAS